MQNLRRFYFLVLLALLVCISGLSAQTGSNPPASADLAKPDEKSKAPAPFLRSTANLVVVDVTVTRDGHPVKGLQADAFHVLEDGKEQPIKSFEEHGPASGEANAEKRPALPPNTYTNATEAAGEGAINVLLLDAVNTPVEDQAYARKKIIEYLKTIPPGTRMAVFTLASRLRMVQGFTTDSDVLLAALKKNTPG